MLLALEEPAERWNRRLAWSTFRRRHQAIARRCHIRRRKCSRDEGPPGAGRAGNATVQVLSGGSLELSEERWGRIRPLLPPQKPAQGRPGHDQRRLLAGMLWVMRMGAAWREVPERFGAWQTLYACYQRWRKAGLWPQILAALQDGEPHT